MIEAGVKLLCHTTLEDDFEQNGIDFLDGKEYNISCINSNKIYVETDNESEIVFDSVKDLKEIFIIA